jgi:hypothetical protein
MQLEEAYAEEITKPVERVDKMEERTNTTATERCYRQQDASSLKYGEKHSK